MDTAEALMRRLRALDIRLRAEQGQLRVSAPRGALTSELETALRAHKAQLLSLVLAGERVPNAQALARIDRQQPLRLSYFQERLWMLGQMRSGDTTYNFASVSAVAHDVDINRLLRAIRQVVSANEILRARFVLDGQTPVVHVAAAADTAVLMRDLQHLSDAGRTSELDNVAVAAAHEPFDLAKEAPVRFTVLQTGAQSCALLISVHHIAMDAWSMGVLRTMIADAYMGGDPNHGDANHGTADHGTASRDAGTADTRLQYADYAAWQRAQAADSRSVAYWKQQLARLPQYSTFAVDFPRRDDTPPRGETIDFMWSRELSDRVRAVARELDATVYMMLIAAMAGTLSRATGQVDIALGSPVGTRDDAALETMLGPIVNLMVLRVQLEEESTFAELVSRARDAVLDAHSHKDVPFERLVQELNPDRAPGSSPLFQVAVVLHSVPDAAAVAIVSGGAIFDVTLFVTERDGLLDCGIEYRTDLFDVATIRRIISWITNLMTAAVADPHMRVSALPLMSATEMSETLAHVSAAPVPINRADIVAQFADAAVLHADRTAVTAADAVLSYRELYRRASAVAAALHRAGVRRGEFVALATDRTSAMVSGALGILMAGAAYVPIDSAYPADRIAFMLHDSDVRHVVATSAAIDALSTVTLPASVIRIDALLANAFEPCDAYEPPAEAPAYLIYTSGSTGRPKGVAVPHSALTNFLGAMHHTLAITPDDRVLCTTPPSFDISVLEMLLPLMHGASTVIAQREDATDGERLGALIDAQGITLAQSTPAGWRLLMNAGWTGSPRVTAIVGGETVSPVLADWLSARVKRLWNGYGPTETTVYSTMGLLTPGAPVTIGRPVANTRVYLLDSAHQPVPLGVPGEICIGGDGVALGYHGRKELTAEKFIAEPMPDGGRMYCTGDIGLWHASGELVHLGRIDGQVKLRGHRIETGELERALEQHAAVQTAIVGVRSLSVDDTRLVSWVQLRDGADSTPSELRAHLRRLVPAFMIPSMVVIVDKFPLTPSGKINRAALPEPFGEAAATVTTYKAPGTPTERVIAEVWAALLGVPKIGVHDAFFELGGHSLLAMSAAREISSRLGRTVEPRLLFFRTLGQLAEACDLQTHGSIGI